VVFFVNTQTSFCKAFFPFLQRLFGPPGRFPPCAWRHAPLQKTTSFLRVPPSPFPRQRPSPSFYNGGFPPLALRPSFLHARVSLGGPCFGSDLYLRRPLVRTFSTPSLIDSGIFSFLLSAFLFSRRYSFPSLLSSLPFRKKVCRTAEDRSAVSLRDPFHPPFVCQESLVLSRPIHRPFPFLFEKVSDFPAFRAFFYFLGFE